MNYRKWTEEDKQFLNDNYTERGGHYCAEKLGRNFDSIKVMANRLGLKGKGRNKTHEEYENELFEREIDVYPLERYAGAHKPILHCCLEDHEWLTTPNEVRRGKGCPNCADTSFKLDKPAILYYVKIEDDTHCFYKVGVTNRTIRERLYKDLDKRITILAEYSYDKGSDALKHETEILADFADFRVTIPGWLKSKGNTELFNIDISSRIQQKTR